MRLTLVVPSLLTVTLILALVGGVSYWVLIDARKRLERRRPVVAVFLGLTIDEPQTWAVLCLVLSVLFIPMYLVARRVSD